MRDLYDTFGPDGTGDLMVFHLEADDQTTQADLEGTGTATAGDWITGTTYPIIDNAGSIFDDYAGAYYPTIYTICPDGILTESGQASFEDHVAELLAIAKTPSLVLLRCAATTVPRLLAAVQHGWRQLK